MRSLLVIAVGILCLMAGYNYGQAQGATLSVGPSSTFPSIKEALVNATDGDIIQLEANTTFSGVNNTNIDLTARNITIEGADRSSIIDCAKLPGTRAFSILQPPTNQRFNATVTLRSMTICNCDTTTGNLAAAMRRGGAIYAVSLWSRIVLDDVLFFNNRGTDGGAIYAEGAAIQQMNQLGYPISVTAVDSEFRNNQATLSGGSVSIINGVLAMTDTFFQNNTAQQDGGALDISSTAINFLRTHFVANRADDGGAVYRENGGTGAVTEGIFRNNEAASGGAWYGRGASTSCTNCLFDGNIATNDGGAALIEVSGGGLIPHFSNFTNNVAGTSGGAFSVVNRGTVNMNNCLVNGNRGGRGGAVAYESQSKGTIRSTTITGNTANDGGAFFLQYSATLELIDSKVQNNKASSTGGIFWCSDSKISVQGSTQFSGNSASQDPEIHCSYEVPLTKCTITGTSEYTDFCPDQDPGKDKISDGMVAVIIIVVVFGSAIVGGILAFILYFTDKKHRQEQGMLWNVVDDEGEKGKGGKKPESEEEMKETKLDESERRDDSDSHSDKE